MQNSTVLILIIATAIILAVIIAGSWITMSIVKHVFTSQKKPENLTKIVSSFIYVIGQILFGVLIIGIICAMMLEGKIKEEAGVPVISGIVGYVFGKSYKGTSENKWERRTRMNIGGTHTHNTSDPDAG